MTTISSALSDYHNECNSVVRALSSAVKSGDWDRVSEGFLTLREAMAAHFSVEESVVFPAYEARTGHSNGPTRVLRAEHGWLRTLAERLHHALDCRDADLCTTLVARISVTLRGHQEKEARLMHPMLDEVLGTQSQGILDQLHHLASARESTATRDRS